MAPDEATSPPRSTVEIRSSIEEARQEAETYRAEDATYSELMSTHVSLGELLESGRTDSEYEQECRAHVDRLIELGKAQDREWQQRWAVWLAKNTTVGGDVW